MSDENKVQALNLLALEIYQFDKGGMNSNCSGGRGLYSRIDGRCQCGEYYQNLEFDIASLNTTATTDGEFVLRQTPDGKIVQYVWAALPYFLKDCSLEYEQFVTYRAIKKQVYDSLQGLSATISSKEMFDQTHKSITLLLEGGDLAGNFDYHEISVAIAKMSSTLHQELASLTDLQKQAQLGSGDQ